MFKVNNKNTRATSATPLFFLLTLNTFPLNFEPFSSVSIVDIEQINVFWDEE